MTVKLQHKGMVFKGCGRKDEATYYIYTSMCKGCGLCIVKCPVNAKGEKCLQWSKEVGIYATPAVEPNPDLCVACGMCEQICPDRAIRIEK
jgi:2-oxoglutarate ferredoxin oxidoreductase subunit delta